MHLAFHTVLMQADISKDQYIIKVAVDRKITKILNFSHEDFSEISLPLTYFLK